jgi:hypothetical protein
LLTKRKIKLKNKALRIYQLAAARHDEQLVAASQEVIQRLEELVDTLVLESGKSWRL